MILGVYRCFRRALRLLDNLHWYHHVMVFITILVPLVWSLIITVRLTDWVSLRGGLHLVAFVVFLVVAELAVAFALTRDKFNAEGFVSHEVGVVSGEVRTLRERHEDLIERHGYSIEDLRRQIDDQDEVFRSALEGLGVALPPREVVLHAQTIGSNVTMPAPTVRPTGGSKWGRLVRLFQRYGRLLKETVWGKPDHP